MYHVLQLFEEFLVFRKQLAFASELQSLAWVVIEVERIYDIVRMIIGIVILVNVDVQYRPLDLTLRCCSAHWHVEA